jgi:hypothetical protein
MIYLTVDHRDGPALLLTLFAGFLVPLSQLRPLSQEKPSATGK